MGRRNKPAASKKGGLRPFYLVLAAVAVVGIAALAYAVKAGGGEAVLEPIPVMLIMIPILLPVVEAFGMNPIHFGIMMVLNLCVGVCTPPVGSVLFVGCGVANVTIVQVIRPLLPMFLAMIVVLLLVTFIPALSLWLPSVFGL